MAKNDLEKFGFCMDKILLIITSIAKVIFGLATFIISVKEINSYYDIPPMIETKYYYVFMSLYLILDGLDNLIDTASELYDRCPKYTYVMNIFPVLC